MSSPSNPIQLDRCDRQLLAHLERLAEDEQRELLRDLRAERALECGIYNHREQWMWAPWIACLTVAGISQTSANEAIRVGLATLTGVLALTVAVRSRPGLRGAYNALTERHKWVVALTSSLDAAPSVRVFAFEGRLIRLKAGVPVDDVHATSFRFPLHAWCLTLLFWLPLIALSVESCFRR